MTEFVAYPDPRLGQAADPAPLDAGLLAVGARLKAAAEASGAWGLAGAHIGAVAPVIIVNLGAAGQGRDDLVLYNPVVVAVSEQSESGTEASVSLPGVEAEISRPVWAEVRYEDEAGVRTRRFEGFAARVVQHEIEQMNGRFFLANLSRLKREALLRKAEKARRRG